MAFMLNEEQALPILRKYNADQHPDVCADELQKFSWIAEISGRLIDHIIVSTLRRFFMSKKQTNGKRKRQQAEAKTDKAAENTKRKAKQAKPQQRSHEREHEFH